MNKTMKSLENKSAIITGAGSGMGRSMALLFASEGAKVVVADLKADRVEAVVKEIASKNGTAIGFAGNIAKEEDVNKLMDACMAKYGTIDVLVNDAGIMDDFTPVADVTDEL